MEGVYVIPCRMEPAYHDDATSAQRPLSTDTTASKSSICSDVLQMSDDRIVCFDDPESTD